MTDSPIDDYPPAWVKRPHRKGCPGSVVNRYETLHVDRTGREGNGSIVAHIYTCNHRWDGCNARVLVAERAIRRLAAVAVGEAVQA